MVGDKKHQDLICWNNAGTSFLITNSKAFSRQVLPEYFKHGNFSSFVRQLNMYGFRKINKAPRIKRGVASQEEIWEFSHPKFQRDWPDMLWEIKRKAVESDVLRRETGDMQACFSMVQQSQDNLLEQFRLLQDNFSTMLRGFEDLKKSQLQIQMGIQRLSQFDNNRYDTKTFDEPVTLNSDPLINHHQRFEQNAIYVKGESQNRYDNPSVFVTSPSNLYQQQYPQQQQQFCIPQENYFLDAVNTPLPPSPLSSSPSFASENFS
ncbi:winged helix DNA-binding domain-containing protein [Lichtheimia hyalospora FSU 10163]|nr:winged helix DNA-binding domain-containing protein [Lichtheimia hyalospora FSU 10163]